MISLTKKGVELHIPVLHLLPRQQKNPAEGEPPREIIKGETVFL